MMFQPLIPIWILSIMLLLPLGVYVVTHRKRLNRSWRPSASFVRRSLTIVLLFAITSGLSVTAEIKSPGASNVDVLVLIDTTQSMAALDYDGTTPRVTGAKKDIMQLATELKGASFGIVTFDTKASTLLPFSSNQQTVQAALDSVQIELAATARGSSIDKPLEIAKSQLEARRASNPERQRLLIYVGDGENTAGEEPRSFSGLKSLIDGGAVLGYGTPEGARMVKNKGQRYDSKSTDYVKAYDAASNSFQPALSKIDQQKLTTIANDLGVSFVQRSGNADPSLALAAQSINLEGNDRKIRVYQNLYFVFAIPLGLLLTYEYVQLIVYSRRTSSGVKR